MLSNARFRARRDGLPCTITEEDIEIPTHCPVLGRRLTLFEGRQGGSDDSPSLDKVIPELGYIPGNVLVVSQKANRLKNQLSTTQLIAFARLYADAERTMRETYGQSS
jgi:hypothetical protein